MATLLNQIGGRVAAVKQRGLAPISLDDPLFNRDAVCKRLLREAISLTGSTRGEVCLVEDEVFARIKKTAVFPEKEEVGKTIQPESVIGRLYLKRKIVDDYIYISDTREATKQLRAQGFGDAEYKTCDTSVLSELAAPIVSDGTRVGIINIESNQGDAYTRGHVFALQGIADQIGWAYYETRQRVSSGARSEFLVRNPRRFHDLLTFCRLLAPRRMHFILYEIDYLHGRLRGYFDREKLPQANVEPPIEFTFSERSLATLVLRGRKRVFIRDADLELQGPLDSRRLSADGCRMFDIHGPVFGMPILTSGNTSAVLVGWTSRVANDPGDPDGPVTDEGLFRDCARFAERMHRLSQMIASDSSKENVDSPFLKHLNHSLQAIDNGEPWDVDELRNDPERRDRLIKVLLESLLHESVGLLRVRLWKKVDPSGRFGIVASATADAALWKNENEIPWGEYVGKAETSNTDTFCRYTWERFAYDPYARHQDKAMFGQPDMNHDRLRKDPDGAWIVAPIVSLDAWCAETFPQEPMEKSRQLDDGEADDGGKSASQIELLGFISADMHCPVSIDGTIKAKDRGKDESDPVNASIRRGYAMDIVSDLIEPLLASM